MRFVYGDGTDGSLCTPGLLWKGTPFGNYLGKAQDNLVRYIQTASQQLTGGASHEIDFNNTYEGDEIKKFNFKQLNDEEEKAAEEFHE